MATQSIYSTFQDDYGRDPIRERYGMNEYTYDAELRRRQREANARASEEQAFGLELRNAKELAAMEYDTRERVDTEAQAADFFTQLPQAKSPQEVVDLLRRNRKAANDPSVRLAAESSLKGWEVVSKFEEKAAELGGYFGDYQAAVSQGIAPQEAFAATQVQRNQDIMRSQLEGLGIKAPEDPKELERLSARAAAMEVDPATKQLLTMEYRAADAVVKDPMTTDEEKADAREQLDRITRQMSGPRQLAEETPDERRAYIQRALGR